MMIKKKKIKALKEDKSGLTCNTPNYTLVVYYNLGYNINKFCFFFGNLSAKG